MHGKSPASSAACGIVDSLSDEDLERLARRLLPFLCEEGFVLRDESPPPRRGGRPASPDRNRFYKLFARDLWNAQLNKRGAARYFLSRHPEAKRLFDDADILRNQFRTWLNKP